MKLRYATLFSLLCAFFLVALIVPLRAKRGEKESQFLGSAEDNSKQLIDQGRQIFRFDTYGDEGVLDRSAADAAIGQQRDATDGTRAWSQSGFRGAPAVGG